MVKLVPKFEDNMFSLAPDGATNDHWTQIRWVLWKIVQRQTKSKAIEQNVSYYNPTGADIVFMCKDGKQTYAHSLMLKRIPNFCSIFDNAGLQDAFGQTVIVLPDTNAATVSKCLDWIYNGNMFIDDTPQIAKDLVAVTLKQIFGIELVNDALTRSNDQTSESVVGKSYENEKDSSCANSNYWIDEPVSQIADMLNEDDFATICTEINPDYDNILDIVGLCPLEMESQDTTITASNNLNEVDLNQCTEEANESINAKNDENVGHEGIYDLDNQALEHTQGLVKELVILSNCSKKSAVENDCESARNQDNIDADFYGFDPSLNDGPVSLEKSEKGSDQTTISSAVAVECSNDYIKMPSDDTSKDQTKPENKCNKRKNSRSLSGRIQSKVKKASEPTNLESELELKCNSAAESTDKGSFNEAMQEKSSETSVDAHSIHSVYVSQINMDNLSMQKENTTPSQINMDNLSMQKENTTPFTLYSLLQPSFTEAFEKPTRSEKELELTCNPVVETLHMDSELEIACNSVVKSVSKSNSDKPLSQDTMGIGINSNLIDQGVSKAKNKRISSQIPRMEPCHERPWLNRPANSKSSGSPSTSAIQSKARCRTRKSLGNPTTLSSDIQMVKTPPFVKTRKAHLGRRTMGNYWKNDSNKEGSTSKNIKVVKPKGRPRKSLEAKSTTVSHAEGKSSNGDENLNNTEPLLQQPTSNLRCTRRSGVKNSESNATNVRPDDIKNKLTRVLKHIKGASSNERKVDPKQLYKADKNATKSTVSETNQLKADHKEAEPIQNKKNAAACKTMHSTSTDNQDVPEEQLVRCSECKQLFRKSDFWGHFTGDHPGTRIDPTALEKVPISQVHVVEDANKLKIFVEGH